MNIQTAINSGEKILKKKSISTANLDSEILLASTIKKDRKYILLNPLQEISRIDYNFYKILIKKRSYRKPIAQLTNKKFFWNSEFYVNNETLIPRPETELIIENILKLTKHRNNLNILDIGIGSGCILLSILKEKKNFYGTGIDISNECLHISRINALNLNLLPRLKLVKSNIDNFSNGKYDLVISNPPYIKNYRINYLDDDVKLYEPKVALDGGIDGYSNLKKVIKKSSKLLKTKGKLILEIDDKQKNITNKILKQNGFYTNKIVKDLAKKYRCIVSTKI